MIDPVALLILAGIGGLLALDGSAVGQFMISRPIVAATLGGWLAGAPAEGAFLGLVLEGLHLSVLPFGAATVPESGPASLVGGWIYAVAVPGPGALLTVCALVLGWAWICGETVRRTRQLNGRIAIREGIRAVDPGSVERRHLAAIGLDLLRGALLTAVAVVLFFHVGAIAFPIWEAMPDVAGVLVGTGLVASIAAAGRFFETHRLRLMVGGAALGIFLLVVL